MLHFISEDLLIKLFGLIKAKTDTLLSSNLDYSLLYKLVTLEKYKLDGSEKGNRRRKILFLKPIKI